MNKKDLERFKKRLLKLREELLSELSHIAKETLNKSQRDASGDLSGYVYHMADVATDNYNRELFLDLASGEQKILYEIDEALRRIKEKAFGNCQNCNAIINKKRLTAVPYARFCLNCQAKEENKDEV